MKDKILFRDNWWGVNNPWADEMNCYPLLKQIFCSNNLKALTLINSFCQQGLEKFFNDINNINNLAIMIWGCDFEISRFSS